MRHSHRFALPDQTIVAPSTVSASERSRYRPNQWASLPKSRCRRITFSHVLTQFESMKEGVVVINTTRAPLVDQDALIDAVKVDVSGLRCGEGCVRGGA